MGAALVDIDSLSGLRQVHRCTRSVLAASLAPPDQAGWSHNLSIQGLPRNGGGGLTGGALLNPDPVLLLGIAHAIMYCSR